MESLLARIFAAGLCMSLASEVRIVATSFGGGTASVQTTEQANPVQRVTKLLMGLQGQLEDEYKVEEDEYETWRCAANEKVDARKADISEAKTRIDELKQYVADIKAGNIDFTNQGAELAEQVQEITKGLQVIQVNRDSEKKDSVAAVQTLRQAVTALNDVIKIFTDNAKGRLRKPKAFLDALSTRQILQANMLKVAHFGRSLLGARDWRRMFQRGTHTKLIKALTQMRDLFEQELGEAMAKEAKAKKEFKTVTKAKSAMLAEANQELGRMGTENGARGVANADASGQIDSLETQLKTDEKFVEDEKMNMELKSVTWLHRSHLRKAEMKAVEMALGVVNSDDARDTFSKAYGDFLLLQKDSVRHATSGKLKLASRMRTTLESWSKNPSLALIAVHEGMESVDKVMAAIKSLINDKDNEVGQSLAYKERCEKELASSAANARKRALEVDTLSEAIQSSASKYGDLKRQSDEYGDKVNGLKKEVSEINKKRDKDVQILQADRAADAAASSLIAKAVDILKNWKARAGKPKAKTSPAKMVLASQHLQVSHSSRVNQSEKTMIAHLEGMWCQEDAGYICEMDITSKHQAFSCQGLTGIYHISEITADTFHITGGFGGGGGHYDGTSILWNNHAVFHRVHWGNTKCERHSPAFKSWQIEFHGITAKEDQEYDKTHPGATATKGGGGSSHGGGNGHGGNSAGSHSAPQSAEITDSDSQLSKGSGQGQSAEITDSATEISRGPGQGQSGQLPAQNAGTAQLAPDASGKLKPQAIASGGGGTLTKATPAPKKADPNEYQGHSGGLGIIAIMEQIRGELDQDCKQSQLEEDNVKAVAKKEVDDMSTEIKAVQTSRSVFAKDASKHEKKKIEGVTSRGSSSEGLQSFVAFYKTTWKRCQDVIANFANHVKARDMQLDNLKYVLRKLEQVKQKGKMKTRKVVLLRK